MKLITLFTKILQFFPGEFSHNIALKSLKTMHAIGILRFFVKKKNFQSYVTRNENITNLGYLENRLGIAAGLDKNGEYIDCLAALGIGFIEVGTVTPKPQSGNTKPRLFRNKKERYLLNRLGFNNDGVENLVKNLKSRKSSVPLGVSIGKNFSTSNDEATKDYLYCLEKVYKYSSYIAINISSPNTKDLRNLSNKEHLGRLLRELKMKQAKLTLDFRYVPLYIKLSPDEELERLEEICEVILENRIDGIICSNTTINHKDENGLGGLSGAPLKKKATEALAFVRKKVGNDFPLIASGGVMSRSDYEEKINAGADLVQIYTGLIFEGPNLINDIISNSTERNT